MRLRIALGLVLILGMSGTLAPSVAAPRKKATKAQRTVHEEYKRPAGGIVGGFCNTATNEGCVEFDVLPGERFVSVVVEDALGTEVFATVSQDADGDGQREIGAAICGSSEEPIPIAPVREAPVRVTIWAEPNLADPFCTGGASFGTVTVTFSTRN